MASEAILNQKKAEVKAEAKPVAKKAEVKTEAKATKAPAKRNDFDNFINVIYFEKIGDTGKQVGLFCAYFLFIVYKFK